MLVRRLQFIEIIYNVTTAYTRRFTRSVVTRRCTRCFTDVVVRGVVRRCCCVPVRYVGCRWRSRCRSRCRMRSREGYCVHRYRCHRRGSSYLWSPRSPCAGCTWVCWVQGRCCCHCGGGSGPIQRVRMHLMPLCRQQGVLLVVVALRGNEEKRGGDGRGAEAQPREQEEGR